MLFATRRLSAESVLLVLIVRDDVWDDLPEGLRKLIAGSGGTRMRLGPLSAGELRDLASAEGVTLSASAAEQLCDHTAGHPLYARALLEELPHEAWESGRTLPAPRSFAALVARQLAACAPHTRRLVEATAILGRHTELALAARVAELNEPLAPLDQVEVAGLLRLIREPSGDVVAFPHPLVHAAAYHEIEPAKRAALHLRAAELVDGEGEALRHRVAGSPAPNPELAAALEAFADSEAARGVWRSAAARLLDASRLSGDRDERERRMLNAIEAMVTAGEGAAAVPLLTEARKYSPSPKRDLSIGVVAITGTDPKAGEALLRQAWEACGPDTDANVAATIAYRAGFGATNALKGRETIEWAQRSLAIAPEGSRSATAAHWVMAMGLAYAGRLPEARAGLRSAIDALGPKVADAALALRSMLAWLNFVGEDHTTARAELLGVCNDGRVLGSHPLAGLGHARLALADFTVGAWDDAALRAERAVSVAPEQDTPSIRAMALWAAIQVPAARGDWDVAEELAQLLAASPPSGEACIAAVGLGLAAFARARRRPEDVLRALEPIRRMEPREGVDEPGFWPWPDLYADALVDLGRLDEAAALLAHHEALALHRRHATSIARLRRVRGRLEAARGAPDRAEAAFRSALERIQLLPLPWDRALIELAFGQHLRRRGSRRSAAALLNSAKATLTDLGAVPDIERSVRELDASALVRRRGATRSAGDLTPQERLVARLVSSGMSNREVAAELLVSAKTIEVHLTRIYAKLGVGSRGQLTNRIHEDEELAGLRRPEPRL